MAKPTEISPRAAAQVVTGAVFEEPSFFGPTYYALGNRIARSDQSFFLIRRARAKIPMVFRSDFAANQAIERDEKRDHDFMISRFFGVFEQVFYERLVAGAIERLTQVSMQLVTGPWTGIF